MAKDYARPFYKSAAWIKTQAAYMASVYYVCGRCGGAARVVHHRKHITPQNIHNPGITLDWDNLEALCIECHNAAHGQGACADGVRFNENGDVVRG